MLPSRSVSCSAYFDHMHRYLPALFAATAGRSRMSTSPTGRVAVGGHITRTFNVASLVFDLMGVAWLLRRRKKARPTGAAGQGQALESKR